MVKLLDIALWELRRAKSGVGPGATVVSVFFIFAIVISALGVSELGFHTEDKLYSVVVDDPHLAGIIKGNSKFHVVVVGSGDVERLYRGGGFDLSVSGRSVRYSGSDKSVAALDALGKTVKAYDEARLVARDDVPNAFPVWVTINYLPRLQSFQVPTLSEPHESDSGVEDGRVSPVEGGGDVVPLSVESVDVLGGSDEGFSLDVQNVATPSHIEPPIPFRSVVLTFFFIFPMYFVAQFYSASIMNERVRRKGVVLLTAPVRSFEIVFGKMLPYFAVTLVLVLVIGFGVGGNFLIVPLLLPVVLIFLSTSFFAAVIARSFKELTFVLVFLSVCLSGYLFFPAMFVNVHAVSSISPMSLVVQVLEGEGVGLSEYLFSSVPLYLVSFLVFVFGIFIYREEDLFSQKSIAGKLVDSVDVFLSKLNSGYFSVFSLSALLIPFAFMFQLMVIVVLFNLPVQVSVVVFVVGAALIEEVLKSIGVYALFRRGGEISFGRSVFFGVSSGFGFFVGEKLIVLVVLVSVADSVFGAAMGVGLLVFPLLLHVTSAVVSSVVLRFAGVRFYLVAVLSAVLVHSGYNLYLLRGVVFG